MRRRCAAAVSTSASATVTDNPADFPAEALAPHAIDAISAGGFIVEMLDRSAVDQVRLLPDTHVLLWTILNDHA